MDNKKKFNEYDHLSLTGVVDEMLAFWEQEDIFARSVKNREGATPFVFFEGPPSANGLPGIHHVMART
ncbi:MAG: class I tRNA ligase family protein, partial [Flavobacteriales bacterium]|nr:class I tRNA ligase family protein [Flavobacteriales bacterium]